MKFREYDNVRPMILGGYSMLELERKIEDISTRHNIIDLQYSTTTLDEAKWVERKENVIHYSVFLLVQEKNL